MSTASVTLDRTSLDKPPLVIADDGDTYRLTAEGLGYVVRSVRSVSMADNPNVHGSEIIGFSLNATALPLELFVIGSTWAEVDAAYEELCEALFRLSYEVTREVDGVSHTYLGGPCAPTPARDVVDPGVVEAHFDTYAVSIPLPYPLPQG